MDNDTGTVKAPLFERMAEAAADAVQDLVRQHWPQIEAARQDSGKNKIGVSVALKFTAISDATYRLDTRIAYATKHSDEREDMIAAEDPRQAKLSLADIKEGRA
jgi:hypothetical protein